MAKGGFPVGLRLKKNLPPKDIILLRKKIVEILLKD